jgi:SGNH hydrolase-like domain, acetyltransferase AlgX
MRAAHFKVALFVLFMLVPVASLLAFGAVEGYGSAQTEFPPLGKVLRGKKGRFDQFGDAVMERSIVRKMAIQVRNWTGYRLVGFVDNERLVSGNDGWLFYGGEFNKGRCIDERDTARRLRIVAAVMDIGRAAGIDMVFSMSPNKSTIYPEALNSAVRGYWKCRVESIAALRRLIRRELPDLIDHTEPLLAEKMRHPHIALYFKTDSHWTLYGGAIALRQLLAAIYPDAHIPAPRLSEAMSASKTDLTTMLLLSVEEQGPMAEPLLERELKLPANRKAVETLIVHDSFYARIGPQILEALPDPVTMLNINKPDSLRADELSADRLIINVVERKFLLDRDLLTWDEVVPIAILKRNMRRAQDCRAFEAAGAAAGGGRRDIAIRAVTSGYLPCLRLSVTAKTKRTDLEIALPDPETGAFEPGHTLEYRIKHGTETIAFVLPAYAAGSSIEVSAGDATISAIEVGEIPSAGGVSDQP